MLCWTTCKFNEYHLESRFGASVEQRCWSVPSSENGLVFPNRSPGAFYYRNFQMAQHKIVIELNKQDIDYEEFRQFVYEWLTSPLECEYGSESFNISLDGEDINDG